MGEYRRFSVHLARTDYSSSALKTLPTHSIFSTLFQTLPFKTFQSIQFKILFMSIKSTLFNSKNNFQKMKDIPSLYDDVNDTSFPLFKSQSYSTRMRRELTIWCYSILALYSRCNANFIFNQTLGHKCCFPFQMQSSTSRKKIANTFRSLCPNYECSDFLIAPEDM